MRKLLATAVILMGGVGLSPIADATPLLTFGQSGGGNTITATDNTVTTTISGTAVPITVTSFLGGGTPFDTLLTLSLTSANAISTLVPGPPAIYEQEYTGMAVFSSGGTNYLTAVFTDALFAIQGASTLTISASEPPGAITFTSDVLPAADFQDPLGISFSFANVVPPVAVDGATLAGFTSTISGTSSTNFVPEPATLAVLGMGIAGLGVARRRRRS